MRAAEVLLARAEGEPEATERRQRLLELVRAAALWLDVADAFAVEATEPCPQPVAGGRTAKAH